MVIKADGSTEVYRHTKVLGTIANALIDTDIYFSDTAELLSEAVTTYLKRDYGNRFVSFDEIQAMIEAVLEDTDHVKAALALRDHTIHRQFMRSRIEVIQSIDQQCVNQASASQNPLWNKTIIIQSLMAKETPADFARVIAGMVEEKVIRLGVRQISRVLINAIVGDEIFRMEKALSAFVKKIIKESRENENLLLAT